MEVVLYVLAVPVACIIIYVVARFIFVAYFKTKTDFERKK